jgi:hypothetical protein
MDRTYEIAFVDVEPLDDAQYRLVIATDDGERFEFAASHDRLEALAAAIVSAAGIEGEEPDDEDEGDEPLLTVL